jgi:ribosomal protein L11 methyltransferase
MPAPRPGWQRSTLHALFGDEAAASAAAQLLLAQDWTEGLLLQSLQPLPDQDWVRLTQSQFDPVRITDGFWVVPSWHAVPADAQRVIRLDPGLAFGTGTHPTTRMCLRWLAGQAATLASPGLRVLDYGCGSGILAIGAALHGARDIDAVDIDPAAVQATMDNAAANNVRLRAGPPEAVDGGYGVVLANILATPLKLLAPLLCERLRPQGQLALAGILERQADELKAAYAPWVALQVSDAEDGWILMTGRREAGTPG